LKKIIGATLVALSCAASAADYFSVDIDSVNDQVSGARSTAQYIRAGKEVAGIQMGVQGRTAVAEAGGMFHSLEVTGGKNIGPFTPFVGIGFDSGANGARNADYKYGLVGATAGMKVNPVTDTSTTCYSMYNMCIIFIIYRRFINRMCKPSMFSSCNVTLI